MLDREIDQLPQFFPDYPFKVFVLLSALGIGLYDIFIFTLINCFCIDPLRGFHRLVPPVERDIFTGIPVIL